MTDAAIAQDDVSFKWSRSAGASVYQAPEAFLCLLSLAASADHGMAVLESEWLQQLTRRWWERGVMREHDVEALNLAVCARLAKGEEAALSEASAALPAPCRVPVFAQALDIMLLNGSLRPQEAEFARELATALAIPEAQARALHECLMLKNAY